ncbi:MAG: NTP transferase domain-containing protein [Bacillota bacterium]
MVDALVLAGSKNDGPLRQCSSAPYEAMIAIGRKTMVEYVVDALRSSERIGRIIVVGPSEMACLSGRKDVRVISARGNLMENVSRGVRELPGANRILITTCDIPMITPRAIEDFLDRCEKRPAQIYYPVVPREVVEKEYVRVRRTYVTLREGEFTGGNIFLVDPGTVERCMKIGQRLVDARKSPVQLSRIVGMSFLLRFLLKKVTIKEAEEKVSALLGVEGAVVVSAYPEVGVDVDKPSDLELVRNVLDTA